MIDFASFLPTLGFLGYVLYRLEFAFTGGQFVVYLILVANGLLFLFATVLAVASLSFWTTQSSGLARIFDSLMKVGRYPIEIFEGFWRSIFLYILPLVLIAQLPSERKRCELAAALLHDPKIILLDEPTNAMDLMSAGRVRQFIRDEAREGNRAVIVTSHNISDIESVCERVTILDKGRILYDGPRRNLNLHHRSVKRIRVRFQGPLQMASLRHLGPVNRLREDEISLEVDPADAPQTAFHLLATSDVRDISITDPPLEEILASIYGKTSERNCS